MDPRPQGFGAEHYTSVPKATDTQAGPSQSYTSRGNPEPAIKANSDTPHLKVPPFMGQTDSEMLTPPPSKGKGKKRKSAALNRVDAGQALAVSQPSEEPHTHTGFPNVPSTVKGFLEPTVSNTLKPTLAKMLNEVQRILPVAQQENKDCDVSAMLGWMVASGLGSHNISPVQPLIPETPNIRFVDTMPDELRLALEAYVIKIRSRCCKPGQKRTPGPYQCRRPHCPANFSAGEALRKHLQATDPQIIYRCNVCSQLFYRKDRVFPHLRRVHGIRETEHYPDGRQVELGNHYTVYPLLFDRVCHFCDEHYSEFTPYVYHLCEHYDFTIEKE